MSGNDSRSPSGDCVWSTKIALPPSVLIAASNVSRVRSDAFSKNITSCRDSSALRKSSGWFFTAWASSITAAISSTENAVSDWMPSDTVCLAEPTGSGASAFGFIITVLLPIGVFSCRHFASHCNAASSKFGKYPVERNNRRIDVLAL